ncbi:MULTISPECIES: MFS transporter [unclassified Saccharopolyspora]|uniref:MFS transporter n=1 Tax=unclassified Saccharopolyspora TaxID=2646250 RepID=UPI001CD370A5|nr:MULTISPECIES: MFS transporter [unclassified Saccharopolyspora]MCA1186989.1 MFS transporter [Saccharopolyspora sp. 6T]MCA1192632.1 MFS transporter [Saccharopolyspora sp. 6V]MCA1229636.1 MFS transporter [Saccharopolyspora sp. 6M]MCA1283462.1 MFS transporter [Saccharopolyspora sp. 7B]
MTEAIETVRTASTARRTLPFGALVVMAMVGFIVIATETMPAGLLAEISHGLDTSPGVTGQLVSAYALGTVLAAIPSTALTRTVRRKPVLLVGIVGFVVANTVTALAPGIVIALIARFVAGGFSGLLWGMLAGYARRIAAPEHAGRALAIAMTGTPVALAVGTPLGSWLGAATDWRWVFGAMSALSVIAFVLTVVLVPDAPGQSASSSRSLRRVVGIPGVGVILVVVFVWMFAHNLEYTYIAEYLGAIAAALPVGVALVVFGVASLVGVWLTGVAVDRHLRRTTLAGVAAFVVGGLVLAVGGTSPVLVIVGLALWGVGFGGAATQLQTAMALAAGDNADVANSILTVAFNLAIFAAAAAGATLVDGGAATVLPLAMAALSLVALALVAGGRRHAFTP